MMLPRLHLLRELLREDGSIWVTIDDNEGHGLKVLTDKVFGRRCFVATCVWQKRYLRENRESTGDAGGRAGRLRACRMRRGVCASVRIGLRRRASCSSRLAMSLRHAEALFVAQ